MELFSPILLKCPLFRNICEADLTKLLLCMNAYTKSFQENEYVFLEDDEVNSLGILLSGAAEIIKENPAGARHIVSFLSPGEMFAEGIVCTGKRISPVTVSIRKDSDILMIPYDKIIKTCTGSCKFHHQLIQNMMLILGDKNLNLNYKLELLSLKGMREKLATYLIAESKRQNSLTFQIIPNRNELSEYLNVARTSMCRELARMKEEEILDYYQNSFKILSLEKLKLSLLIPE